MKVAGRVGDGLETAAVDVHALSPEGRPALGDFQDQFRALQRAPATIETADAMADLFHTLRQEADQLPENLQLREDYLALLEQIAAK